MVRLVGDGAILYICSKVVGFLASRPVVGLGRRARLLESRRRMLGSWWGMRLACWRPWVRVGRWLVWWRGCWPVCW